MRKVRKFIKKPGIFFRDYLNKKYPTINNDSAHDRNTKLNLANAYQIKNEAID